MLAVDGWSICNFCTVFEEKSSTETGDRNDPYPLVFNTLRGVGEKRWMAPREDHDSRANVVDCGLCWNVNIKLIVAFAAWQVCVVKAPVRASGAQAACGIRAGAFPSQIMESVWKLVLKRADTSK